MKHVFLFTFQRDHSKICAALGGIYLHSFHEARHNGLRGFSQSIREATRERVEPVWLRKDVANHSSISLWKEGRTSARIK